LAEQIYARLPAYASLMQQWLAAMSGQAPFDLT